jgi:hypothetical protein
MAELTEPMSSCSFVHYKSPNTDTVSKVSPLDERSIRTAQNQTQGHSTNAQCRVNTPNPRSLNKHYEGVTKFPDWPPGARSVIGTVLCH